MVDSGSEPTAADAEKHFPKHNIAASKKQGQTYTCADGGERVGGGQIHAVHLDDKLGDSNFAFQNLKVHCPSICVRALVEVGCSVTFKGRGGTIKYKDGRKLRFLNKDGVYVIDLKVVSPEMTHDAFGSPLPVFSRQGR